MKLKVYVLTDNVASSVCKAEHGLSFLVVFDNQVLFDTGQTNLFLENARILEAPIHDTNYLILSHGHYDHGNGLKFIDAMKLICHPDVFNRRFSGKEHKYVGLDVDEAELSKRFAIHKSKEPVWISDKMVYLGEIPRKMNFEKNTTTFYLDGKMPDPILDDTGMAIIMSQGLFVISGCAHSGICNIIEHARFVTGISKVFGVMGGFHLMLNNNQTQKTIEYIKELQVEVVMPSHCTALPALTEFYQTFGGEQVKAGTLYTFDEQF